MKAIGVHKIRHFITASEAKCRRHHTNHGVALTAERDGLIKDFGIAAKTRLPQPMTKDHHVVASWLIFFYQEVAAQLWLSAEHRKKAFGDFQTDQPLRIPCANQVKTRAPKGNQSLEDCVLLLPLKEVAGRNREFRELWHLGFANHHQPVRILERQRSQQHAVYDAEDCDIGANTERQRNH